MTSINGLGGALPGLGRPDIDRQSPAEEQPQRVGSEARAPATSHPPSTPGDTAAAGVDPELWSLLSADERVFYLRNAMTGPLTYGPGSEPSGSAAPRSRLGGRIDVRG